ncbi:MAG: hypothetical protein QF717_16735, partial [SAR202 cluster bacterium]|nr:hypothetical protein [SAR202 cluster bacterium]
MQPVSLGRHQALADRIDGEEERLQSDGAYQSGSVHISEDADYGLYLAVQLDSDVPDPTVHDLSVRETQPHRPVR